MGGMGKIGFISTIYDKDVLLLVLNYDGRADLSSALRRVAESVAARAPGAFFVCGKPFAGAENMAAAYEGDFAPRLRDRFYHEGACFLPPPQTGGGAREGEARPSGADGGTGRAGAWPGEGGASLSAEAEAKAEAKAEAEAEAKAEEEAEAELEGLPEALAAGDLRRAIDCLREKTARILEERSMSEKGVKLLAQKSVYRIIVALGNLGAGQDALDDMKRGWFPRLSAARFAAEFKAVLTDICDELADLEISGKAQFNGSSIYAMLEYINSNFSAPLTLADLAGRFGFSYHYLSTYFGANKPEGFSKYLNGLRVRKAEELLGDPQIPISEISGRVGYADHSYFTRVVKKQRGVTPSAYRARIAAGAAGASGDAVGSDSGGDGGDSGTRRTRWGGSRH
jgi:AraC-like DNA-binding protein